MTDNQKYSAPIVPTMESNPEIREYRCPHCGKFLFKGNVKRLNMVCHHCQKMIDADAKDLFLKNNGKILDE